MREIRMLRLTRRELEADPQGTASVLDPTCEGLRGKFPRPTRLPNRYYESRKWGYPI